MQGPLTQGSVPERLAELVFGAIMSGNLRAGERLLEAQFARRFGVAQNTVREAFHILQQRRVVTKRERRGTFVTELTAQDIRDCYEVRLLLEPRAAALAHERATPQQLAQLDETFRRMQAAIEPRRQTSELFRADVAFHELIWKLSGNHCLETALAGVCYPLLAFQIIREHSLPNVDSQFTARTHRSILRAIKNGGSAEVVEKTVREIIGLFRDSDLRECLVLEDKAKGEQPTKGRLPEISSGEGRGLRGLPSEGLDWEPARSA